MHPKSGQQQSSLSLAITVFNEGTAIRELLDSLGAQTRPPAEVIIVDGGSQDDTLSQIKQYQEHLPLKVIVAPGANISQGRNIAINASNGAIIAVTDAGVRLEPDWLEKLTAPLAGRETQPEAVAGFFQADPHNAFELALGATTLPLAREVNPETFLPSSRSVAFTRAAWEASGGYPTWLDYCEDLLFNFRLWAVCREIHWVPEAVVHFRPRRNLRQFARQYYHYARGDGKADLWRQRHLIRYVTYFIALPLLLYGVFHTIWAAVLLVIGGGLYLHRPWLRLQELGKTYNQRTNIIAAFWVPIIRVAGDIAKMLGYPAGLYWRWQHRRQPEIHWRQGLPEGIQGSSGGKVI